MEILPVENLDPKLLQGPENSQHEMSPEFFHIPMQHCFSLYVDHCVWILTISMKLWQDKGCPGIEGLSLLLWFSLTDYANLYCPHETETGYQAWLQKSSIFEENSFLSLAFVRLCETLNSPGNGHGPWGWTMGMDHIQEMEIFLGSAPLLRLVWFLLHVSFSAASICLSSSFWKK